MTTSNNQNHYWLPSPDGTPREVSTESSAVVFIGANGSGKSRLGAWIERQQPQKVHRIGAQRGLNFSDQIQLRSYSASEDIVMYGNTRLSGFRDKRYKYSGADQDAGVVHQSNDFDNVLSALIAKTNTEEHDFFAECRSADNEGRQHPQAGETEIEKLHAIWKDIFPHRTLIYRDSQFKAVSNQHDADAVPYPAPVMSDGERSALYFIAQVLCVPEGLILLIDEPELHMHKSLMNRLWATLEKYRPDCLFIYITHDTQFAAQHPQADKYWVKEYSGGTHWALEAITDQEFPEDLLLDLLGNRKNVLFVEGTKGSLDAQLYSLVYPDYYIVPCGSCIQVIETTKAFSNTDMLHHYKAYGIIDRDYRTDDELASLRQNGVYAIDVAEVENLLITEEIIRCVARSHGQDEDDAMQRAFDYVVDTCFSSRIERQISQATVAELKYRLSSLYLDNRSEDAARQSLHNGLANIEFDEISHETEERFHEALRSNDYRQVIRLFNDKGLARGVGKRLGIEKSRYCDIVIGMLSAGTIDAVSTIGNYMPNEEDIPRRAHQ